MNSNILFITSNGSQLANHFGGSSLKYEKTNNDIALHEWLITNLNKPEYENIEKIVIPIYLGNEDIDFTGLNIGMHIRLSSELGNKRYLPLIFVSSSSKKDIFFSQIDNKSDKTAILLTTPNTTLVDMEIDKIETAINKFSEPLNQETFNSDVLSKFNIENPDPGGNHQLANEWGCFRLAKFAGYTLSQKLPASLFFKYHFHKTGTSLTAIPVVPTNKLSKDCKVLLIDDNAKMGWQEIIEHIQLTQVTSGNVTIDSIETEVDFDAKKADLLQYDVIYLDLRLIKGENHTKIEDYSGAKILEKIKEINLGIQVIILTASNKGWNMEYLLSVGADGYYIKESPEMIVSDKFSEGNFEKLVSTSKKCIERQYLKECFTKHQSIKAKIDAVLSASPSTEKKEFLKEIRVYNEMSFDLLYNASNEIHAEKKKNKFGFAYLSLFKVLERINKYFKSLELDSMLFPNYDYITNRKDPRLDLIANQSYSLSPTINIKKKKLSEFQTLAWICIEKLNLKNQDFVRKLYWAVLRRNKFIHADSTLTGEAEVDRDEIFEEQKSECKRINNEDGYVDLLDILKQIILNIP
jgi:CheY-like chemotaxis protein